METALFQKEVDKSLLTEGMSIPKVYHDMIYKQLGFKLEHGQNCTIKLLIDGVAYEAKLKNQGFDQIVYKDHCDVLQIRYSPSSPLAKALRERFQTTHDAFVNYKSNPNNSGRLIIPKSQKEYLVLYSTGEKGTLFLECITNGEYNNEMQEISKLDEIEYENAIDNNATIILHPGIKKIRRLSKAIGNSLKIVYNYRCQICGQLIGEKYASSLVHAHHIDYFTKSMNNNADNILIVCPNHHGIIHEKNPVFNRENKTYTYPNGYCEGLLLNKHL